MDIDPRGPLKRGGVILIMRGQSKRGTSGGRYLCLCRLRYITNDLYVYLYRYGLLVI